MWHVSSRSGEACCFTLLLAVLLLLPLLPPNDLLTSAVDLFVAGVPQQGAGRRHVDGSEGPV